MSNQKENIPVNGAPLLNHVFERARISIQGIDNEPRKLTEFTSEDLNAPLPTMIFKRPRNPLSNISNGSVDYLERTTPNAKGKENQVFNESRKYKQFTSEDLNPQKNSKKSTVAHRQTKKVTKAQKCNITPPALSNRIVDNESSVHGRRVCKSKALSKDVNSELNRNLLNEFDCRQDEFDAEHFSELENSKIVGIDDLDDDFLCHDDLSHDEPTIDEQEDNSSECGVAEYCSLGGPSVQCQHCNAYMWKEERINKNVKNGSPKFSICCRKGQIQLPANPPTPSFLWQPYNDPNKAKQFKNATRIYNSMFAFTSSGGTVDNSINNGGAPYVYRLNGQNHHVFGSLIPDDGQPPKFCQLYIYDTDNEVSNRMQWFGAADGQKVDPEIVEGLMKMLDERNVLVKKFRVARDRFKNSNIVDLKIILKVCRSESGRENHISPSDEVAGIMVGDMEETEEGRDIIIQKTTGGFEDALAVCRYVGHPDIFLTMTSNPAWDEIKEMMKLIPHGTAQDSPDIIARVFHLKLQQLLDDIQKKSFFGKCLGVMYVVEFQKRGLPHVHMLIWLDSASKQNLKQNVDKYVSAEIPDPLNDKVGYASVKSFMIHGPCGSDNYKSPCMKDNKCHRHFPKKYSARTTFDESGFPIYKRRSTGVTVEVRKAELDNRWVVPYNRDLLVKYQCHMNIEICSHARSLKYLFKYCLKGHDRATVELRGLKRKRNISCDDSVDEIQAFFDGRYICGAEAAYRIFGFDIHHRSISVERLSYHMPGTKNCTFRSNEKLSKVVLREKQRNSKLEAFFELNTTDPNARKYTYDQIPQFYVWNSTECIWTLRKRGLHIGRLTYTYHSAGELWYLRLLLTKVKGPKSFDDLKKFNGFQHPTFQDACSAHGLLDDDKEWHEVLQECSKCGFPSQIRELFVRIMVNCQVGDLRNLWLNHWTEMSDDILHTRRKASGIVDLILDQDEIQFFTLAEIDTLLRSIGKSLQDYPQMPQPPSNYLDNGLNNLLLEERNYDRKALGEEYKDLYLNCNAEQRHVIDSVINSVESKEGGLFFVYGSGGCGKTYVWRTLISKLRSEGKIVLPVASSGIAATLLPGGRTAHSRFKIPILLDECSMCNIGHNSDIAQLIRSTNLIIWDEAPMQHRYSFECLDRSLRDLLRSVDPNRYHMPFGGITVVLGGDFRQILPVINHASRSDIVNACITRSKLWSVCQVFLLKQNMRLNKGSSASEIELLKQFAQWILDVGGGKILNSSAENTAPTEYSIEIPPHFSNQGVDNSVENMILSVYPHFLDNCKSPQYLSERAILTPTNETVSHLNSLIVDKIAGQSFSYFSADRADEFGGSENELNLAFPMEYLNSLSISGMPHHELKLKEGVVVMLMRNLNQILGLCNGTRMIVTKCLKHCVQCEVICGSFVGTRHFIPRIECCPTDTRLPFKLIRKQMPLQICYAMTINKSQGQSLEMVGLFLPKSVFTHGQLYVAISRVTHPKGLKLFIDDDRGCSTRFTQNVVYPEVFYNLPVV